MEDDFDLEGLSREDATQYVAGFITAQKQAARDLQSAEEELDLWKKRTGLAADRGEADLARDSLARAEEAHTKVVRLRHEKHELDFKVTELKDRLARLRQKPEFSVNANALLDQLEGIVGTDHQTSDSLSEAEAEVALQALKKKMESERGNG